MNDCAKNGDYCKFNERFLALLSNLETQEWFSKYEIPGEFEFIFNEEFGEFEKNPKMAQFYEVEYMREIVLGELRGIEQGRTESSTTIPSQLLDKLENVNFNEIYAYLLEPEEELLTGDGGPPDGPLRRKRNTNNYFMSRRKKREGPPPPPGGGFFGPEEREQVSYTDILNNVKRFITAADKILTSARSKRRKRQITPEAKKKCDMIGGIMYTLAMKSGVKDGSQFSLAKIRIADMFNDGLEDLEAIADTSFSYCSAFYDEKAYKIIELNLEELRTFVEMKEFDDGFSQRIR